MKNVRGVGGVRPGWRQARRDYSEGGGVGFQSRPEEKQVLWLSVILQILGGLAVLGVASLVPEASPLETVLY